MTHWMSMLGAGETERLVFLRDLVVMASIGIYPREHESRQRVCINITLAVEDETLRAGEMVGPDELRRVVDYEKLANTARELATTGHNKLVETLAERIASACLSDERVRAACVRVEKLDVFPDAFSAGVEVQRRRPTTGQPVTVKPGPS
jgi:7,8-dihydroneopterin aldolase/epimerase/oxygenase